MMRLPFMTCVLPVLLLGAPAGAEEPPVLRFHFKGLRRSAGVVRCALYSGERDHMKRSFIEVLGRVVDGQADCVFAGVPAGRYSMAAFHDENDNGKLDTNWLGIPKEGLGSSNNAKGRLGPPSWKDASFSYPGGALVQELGPLKYF